ncbi:hypothetical protein MNB_SV-13-1412 [hydrothermal vent metagenome]|uniref:VanZ-like domain-containing protein n=1 Tax=hydrothermal vent metagenome TaxID=652676 RepID=A0A1W1D017_9ZZZZ
MYLKLPLKVLIPLSFFLFISIIIFKADTADYNFAFRLIGNIPHGDKLMHGLLFGLMAWALNYGLDFKSIAIKKPISIKLQLGAIFVLIFATLEELSQLFIASRTFDVGDLVADVVGVVLFSLIRRKKCKK